MNLQQLRQRTLERAEKSAVGSFWTDSELNDYVNEAYLYYWQFLLDANNNGCLKEFSYDIVAGQRAYPYPSDLNKIRLIEQAVSNNRLEVLEWKERFAGSIRTTGNNTSSNYASFWYRPLGLNIILEPTPDFSQVGGLLLTYYFNPPEMVEDTDEPHPAFFSIYHKLIVYRAVVLAKSKEEGIGGGGVDLGPWGAIMQQEEDRFKSAVELPSVQRQHTTLWLPELGGSVS